MTSYYLSLIIVNEMTSRMLSISLENVIMTSIEVKDLLAKSDIDIDYSLETMHWLRKRQTHERIM